MLADDVVPAEEQVPFDMHDLIDGLVDADSFFEAKPLFAAELITGFARIDGRPVGVVANNSAVRGGVLFVDSADKAARFIWLCDAFNVPLLYLADVPGFMIGSVVERQGIIRHGAKMITAVAEATVAQISVIARKAYGAGLYAMAGPGFMPDACIALPTAKIAVMGPQAAVNAVYANRIAEIADPAERDEFVARMRAEYEQDVDLMRLASDLVIDAVINPSELRDELVNRYRVLVGKSRHLATKRHGVPRREPPDGPNPARPGQLSGALSAEWRVITHHSASNAPLNEGSDRVQVRGNATAEEFAAVVAALARHADSPSNVDSPYERWRRVRVAAIRRTDVHPPAPR